MSSEYMEAVEKETREIMASGPAACIEQETLLRREAAELLQKALLNGDAMRVAVSIAGGALTDGMAEQFQQLADEAAQWLKAMPAADHEEGARRIIRGWGIFNAGDV